MGNEVCSLLNELNVIKDEMIFEKQKQIVRKMRQQLHGAAREECVPFSLVTEDQLNFLLRVLESAEGRAKMRMLLRGVIEEREVLVDSIEDVMYRDMEGEDEYDPISVRAEDSPVSRLHLIKTVSSNTALTEGCTSVSNLYGRRKYYKSHPNGIKENFTASLEKRSHLREAVRRSRLRRGERRKKKKKKDTDERLSKQKNSRKKSLKNQQRRKEKETKRRA